jgi:DNA-binding HxlR family transcriptional regulator
VADANRTLTGWETVDDEQCRRATSVVELVGRRWSSGVMLALSRGATRFSEIVATVDGLSDRMLAVRLKELEHGGLIDRVVEPTTPVTVRYRLSPRGRDLLASLQPLQEYGRRWEPLA